MLKKRVWKPIAGFILILLLISSGYFIWSLNRLDILPPLFFFVIVSVMLMSLAVASLFLYAGINDRPSRQRRSRRVIALLLSALITVVGLFGAAVLKRAEQAKQAVTNPSFEIKAVVNVYVLPDDPAQRLADTSGYRYGVLGAYEKDNSDYALADIEGRLGAEVEAVEYDGISEALSALGEGEIRAMAVNENYLSLLRDSEKYSELLLSIRIVDQIVIPFTDTDRANARPAKPAVDDGGEKDETPRQEGIRGKLQDGETFILYLSGNDARTAALTKGRSDVNILMIVNPTTKQILLLNTPRDYYVPNNACGGAMDKLTHCGLFGTYNSMEALEGLYGVSIDNYCQINFRGFEKLIDAIGGVTLNNPQAFSREEGFYPAGEITLNGRRALGFARERFSLGEGDVARGRNQMRLIRAMLDKVRSEGALMLVNYADILESLEGMFATDLTSEEISALAKLAIGELNAWDLKAYTVSGWGGIMKTASGGVEPLYVMRPNEEQVAYASSLVEMISNNTILTEDDVDHTLG